MLGMYYSFCFVFTIIYNVLFELQHVNCLSCKHKLMLTLQFVFSYFGATNILEGVAKFKHLFKPLKNLYVLESILEVSVLIRISLSFCNSVHERA